MRSYLLFLVLIAGLALTAVCAAGTVENYQNGPGASYQTFVFGTGSSVALGDSPAIVQYPNYDGLYFATSQFHIGSNTPQTTNQFSFTYASAQAVAPGSPPSVYSPGSFGMGCTADNFVKIYSGASNFKYSPAQSMLNPIRISVNRVDQRLKTYANGILVYESDSGSVATQPKYYAVTGNVDDLVVGPPPSGIVGTIPNTWYVAKDLIDDSMRGVYDDANTNRLNEIFYASYTVIGDPTTATISIDGDHQVQAVPQNHVQVLGLDGQWHDTISPTGFISFNLTQFMVEKPYGRHTVQLQTSEGTVEEEFWYKAATTTATSIDFDRGVYAPQDMVNINSTIGSDYYLPGQYSYRACILDRTTGEYMENWSVTAQTSVHSTVASAETFPASGQYMTLLFAINSQGQEILLDTDTAQVYNNKIIVSGTVYDAQQGTIISGATVALTQSSTETEITGSDGRFEFSGLEKDVLTSMITSKTGYITAYSNATLTEYKRYEIAIALAPNNPTHSGTAVFGTVRSYPYSQPVESPLVTIKKDGEFVNSSTATAKGWYLIDNLDPSTTYTVEVKKSGYLDYSNAVETGTAGSLTQMDPVLTPTFALRVNLKNAQTLATVTSQCAIVLGDGQSEQTTTGSVTFSNVSMGSIGVSVVGSGFENYQATVSMMEDRNETVYLTPSAVVPTTAVPLTTTPAPAIASINGSVYNSMTGGTIDGVNVTFVQPAITRYATSNGAGYYTIANIQNDQVSSINATKTGYTHSAFSFTPTGSTEYIVNLYMQRADEATDPTYSPVAGKAGAGGMVLGGPYHQLVLNPTVTASNATWNGTAILADNRVWYFTDLEPGQTYTFTAAASGYVTDSVTATMGAADSFTTVSIVLDQLYDITIRIKDATSLALILQQVEITTSFGVTQATSTGSTTFTNVQYGTWTFAATSAGYQQGGISLLAYGDLTQDIYLLKLTTGQNQSGIEYAIPPKHVELIARNWFGVPLSGVNVSVKGGETTLPDRSILDAIFGWTDEYSSVDLANATMTGTTGTDGGVSFMLTDSVKYQVTFTDVSRGISETVELMPHDNQYLFILGGGIPTPSAGMPNMTLWAEGQDGISPVLHGYYSDPAGATTALRFIVEQQNGTVINEVHNESFAGQQTVSTSYTVAHVTGAQYTWGFRAVSTAHGDIEQWSGITLHSRMLELGIEEGWYFWISMIFIVIFAGFFSGFNIKFGFVLLPLFADLMWYIGWFDTNIAILGIATVLGVLMYITKAQVG